MAARRKRRGGGPPICDIKRDERVKEEKLIWCATWMGDVA